MTAGLRHWEARADGFLKRTTGWWVILALEVAALLTPLFLVDLPPLADWPNHLARMYVLAFGSRDPVLSHMFATHWAIIPNLAIDVIMPPMLRIMPIYDASRIMLAAALLLPLAGALVYSRAVLQRRSFWPLAAGLVSYNAIFILGFINYCIAIGLALMGAALWHVGSKRRPVATALATALIGTGIFFCHIFGALFLYLLVMSRETAALLLRIRGGEPSARWASRRAALVMVAISPVVVLYLNTRLHDVSGPMQWKPLLIKLVWLLGAFLDYHPVLGMAAGACILLTLVICARVGRLDARLAPLVAGVILLATYIAAPFVAKGTGYVDGRLPIMLSLLLFAGIAPTRLPPRIRTGIAAALAMLFCARIAGVGMAWAAHGRDIADVRAAIMPIPPGARVLAVGIRTSHGGYWDRAPADRKLWAYMPLDEHVAALLLIEHRAFWPLLFTVASKQPLVVRPPYDAVAEGEGHLSDYICLSFAANDRVLSYFPSVRNWSTKFDYVLLIDADGVAHPSRLQPGRLRLLVRTHYADLFRVVRTPAK